MDPMLGIDFGTANSCLAWYNPAAKKAEIIRNDDGEEKTPSVIYLGQSDPVVGRTALLKLEDPDEAKQVLISPKRYLTKQLVFAFPTCSLSAIDATTIILQKLKQDAEKLHFRQPVHKVVITCPATYGALERDATMDAARRAGFEDIILLEEPVAAAMAYVNQGFDLGRNILIYDLGAGTFDVTLVTRSNDHSFRLAIEPKGLPRCGGDEFDLALYHFCEQLFKNRCNRPISSAVLDLHFLHLCCKSKESLTKLEQTTIGAFIDGIAFKETITRTQFETLIRDQIESTVQLTANLVAQAKRYDYAVDSVVLIGGSSRIPLIAQTLQQILAVAPYEWQHQDVAVALGAAYHAHQTWQAKTADSQTHKFCIRCGHENSKSFPFCTQCGADLSTSSISCPGCGKRNTIGLKFCPQCGLSIN